jgi:hypothetical protein
MQAKEARRAGHLTLVTIAGKQRLAVRESSLVPAVESLASNVFMATESENRTGSKDSVSSRSQGYL